MKSIIVICLFFAIFNLTFAQINIGGQPYTLLAKSQVNGRTLDLASNLKTFNSIDNENEVLRAQKIKEECSSCRSNFYGTGIDVALDIKRDGRKLKVPGGTLWKLDVLSEGAFGLQFYFDQYILPPEAEFFVYNSKGAILGAFTHINNHPDRKFATALIPGEIATLEYFESNKRSFTGSLSIYKVIHAFKNPRERDGEFGDAKICHEDMSCFSGYDDIKEGIVRIAYYDYENNLTGNCSGFLINNSHPSKPGYLLTADHCLGNDESAINLKKHRFHEWILEFDYELSDCESTDEPDVSKKATNGVKLLTRSSRKETVGTDHALLDLEIPNFANILNVPYIGFDRTVSSSTSTIGIHHPNGDVKKIAFDYDAPSVYENEWEISWDLGITEEGASGSPLIQSSNMLAIGLLRAGYSDCSIDGPDYYPSIGYSWDKKDERFAWDLDHFIDDDYSDPQSLPSYFPENGADDPDPSGGLGGGSCLPYESPDMGVPIADLDFDHCRDRLWLSCYNGAPCDNGWNVTHGRVPALSECGTAIWDVKGNPSGIFSAGIFQDFDFENGKEYVLTYSIKGGPWREDSFDSFSKWKFYAKNWVWTDDQEDCGYPLLKSDVAMNEAGLISQIKYDHYTGWKTYASRFVPSATANKLLLVHESNQGHDSYVRNIKIYDAEYFDAKICADEVSLTNTQVTGNTDARSRIVTENTSVNSGSSSQFTTVVQFQAPEMVFKDGFVVPFGSSFKTIAGRKCFVNSDPFAPTEIVELSKNRITEAAYIVDYSQFQPIYSVSDIEIYTDDFRKLFNEISIYPNPTKGIVNIENDLDESWEYSVLDLSGRVLLQEKASKSSIQIDLSHLNGNLFFIRIVNSKNRKKTVVKKIYRE
jgi:hypothetical protein